jgi:hypothetical protein
MNKELMAEFEAEDAAFGHIWEMPAKLAKSVAVTAAKSLWVRWEEEKLEMIRRDDPRPVYHFSAGEALWLDVQCSTISGDDLGTVYLAKQLGSLLSGLPLDAATWVAFKVAEFAAVREKQHEPVC